MSKDRATNETNIKLNKNKLAEILNECVFLNMVKAMRVVTNIYGSHLKYSNLKPNQLSILVYVGYKNRVRMKEISQSLKLDMTSLLRNIATLEKKKLLKKFSGKDKRIKFVALTEAGINNLIEAIPHWEICQDLLVTSLTPNFINGNNENMKIIRSSEVFDNHQMTV